MLAARMDDFGGRLRQARELRGISLRQVAASTKISAAALEALERNDISKLPGGIFSRAFVRSYAAEVGLDPDRTVREFLDRFNQEPSSSADGAAAPARDYLDTFDRGWGRTAWRLSIAAVALLTLVAAVVLVVRARVRHASPPTGVAMKLAGTPSSPSPPQTAASAVGDGRSDAGAPSAPVIAGAMVLDIHPTSACWVSLTVDGRKLFARLMKSGERESYSVVHEAVLDIGNAGAFAFSLDGRPGKAVGDSGQAKTLTLTPATASQYVK